MESDSDRRQYFTISILIFFFIKMFGAMHFQKGSKLDPYIIVIIRDEALVSFVCLCQYIS